jgi:hypothetical protein
MVNGGNNMISNRQLLYAAIWLMVWSEIGLESELGTRGGHKDEMDNDELWSTFDSIVMEDDPMYICNFNVIRDDETLFGSRPCTKHFLI